MAKNHEEEVNEYIDELLSSEEFTVNQKERVKDLLLKVYELGSKVDENTLNIGSINCYNGYEDEVSVYGKGIHYDFTVLSRAFYKKGTKIELTVSSIDGAGFFFRKRIAEGQYELPVVAGLSVGSFTCDIQTDGVYDFLFYSNASDSTVGDKNHLYSGSYYIKIESNDVIQNKDEHKGIARSIADLSDSVDKRIELLVGKQNAFEYVGKGYTFDYAIIDSVHLSVGDLITVKVDDLDGIGVYVRQKTDSGHKAPILVTSYYKSVIVKEEGNYDILFYASTDNASISNRTYGCKVAIKVDSELFHGLTIQTFRDTYANLWEDSSFALLGTDYGDVVKGTYNIVNTEYGRGVHLVANVGERPQIYCKSTIYPTEGSIYSMGFLYKRIKGNTVIKFAQSTFTYGKYGLGDYSEIDLGNGWYFSQVVNITTPIPITKPLDAIIDFDNRNGSESSEVYICNPIVTKGSLIYLPILGSNDRIKSFVDDFKVLEKKIENLTALKPWSLKNLVTYGDSITAINNGTFSSPFELTGASTWGNRISALCGFSSHRGRGVGGQTFVWNESTWYADNEGNYLGRESSGDTKPEGAKEPKGCFCSWDRITTSIPSDISSTIDCVIIMGGTNDFANVKEYVQPIWSSKNTTDSDWVASTNYNGGDFDLNDFCGAIASTIMKWQKRCPNATIVLATPLPRWERTSPTPTVNQHGLTMYDVARIEKKVAHYMGIPVIDLNGECNINGINYTEYITDAVHPYSNNGKTAIGNYMSGKLQTILPKK